MFPKVCNYYLTLRCNSKCVYCNIWSNKSNLKLKEQSIKQVNENLRDLKKLGVKLIDFTGGEPLLYPHIIDVLQLAKKYGFRTTLTTNCLVYPKYASKLKGLVDILLFSLDSCEEKEHNSQRGVKSYHKVMESIDLSKKIRQKIQLICTITNENFNQIESMIKFAQKNKCILSLNPCFSFFGNDGLSVEKVVELKKYFREAYLFMDLANIELIKNGGNDTKKPVCKAISSFIVISPDNFLLLPCYHKALKKIKINNDLIKIWESAEVKNLRKIDGKFEFCKGCAIDCYMRGSLYQKIFSVYFVLSLVTGLKYLRERMRKQY